MSRMIDGDSLRNRLIIAFGKEDMHSDFSRGKAEGFEDAIDFIDELSESIPVTWLHELVKTGEEEESKAAWKVLRAWKKNDIIF